MSRDLGDIVSYICATYPKLGDLSNARLTKLVYLADWRAAKAGLGQLTSIDWIFNNFGPWVPDVLAVAQARDDLDVVRDVNYYGSPKVTVRPKEGVASVELDRQATAIIDTVVADTQNMYFGEFIDYVYETTPVVQSPRGSHLDLVAFAEAEPLDPLPVSVTERQLSADDFASVAQQLHQSVSRLLLDALWASNVGPDRPIKTNAYLLDDLDIGSFSFGSDIRFLETRRGWTGTVSVAAAGSALVLRNEGKRERYFEDQGYYLADANWDDLYVLLGRQFSGTVEFAVRRIENGVTLEVVGITFD